MPPGNSGRPATQVGTRAAVGYSAARRPPVTPVAARLRASSPGAAFHPGPSAPGSAIAAATFIAHLRTGPPASASPTLRGKQHSGWGPSTPTRLPWSWDGAPVADRLDIRIDRDAGALDEGMVLIALAAAEGTDARLTDAAQGTDGIAVLIHATTNRTLCPTATMIGVARV